MKFNAKVALCLALDVVQSKSQLACHTNVLSCGQLKSPKDYDVHIPIAYTAAATREVAGAAGPGRCSPGKVDKRDCE